MCKCASPGKKYMLTEDDKMFIKSKEIVSKVGYLVGVPRQFFEDGKLLLEVYDSLEAEQDARIVRNLCHIYTMLNRHFSKIQGEMKTNKSFSLVFISLSPGGLCWENAISTGLSRKPSTLFVQNICLHP